VGREQCRDILIVWCL